MMALKKINEKKTYQPDGLDNVNICRVHETITLVSVDNNVILIAYVNHIHFGH